MSAVLNGLGVCVHCGQDILAGSDWQFTLDEPDGKACETCYETAVRRTVGGSNLDLASLRIGVEDAKAVLAVAEEALIEADDEIVEAQEALDDAQGKYNDAELAVAGAEKALEAANALVADAEQQKG